MAQLSYSNSTGSQSVNESNTKLLACAPQVLPPLIFLNYCTFIVLPTESWVTYSCHLGFLECFYQGCLHVILSFHFTGATWSPTLKSLYQQRLPALCHYAPQDTAALGRIHLQDGGPPPAKGSTVWRTGHHDTGVPLKRYKTRPSPARKSLPVSHRPCESPACLQQMQTPTFLSLYLQQM